MATYFSGTSTKSFYKAGSVYQNGNGTYMALNNGQFVNMRTGRATVGSSQDPRVSFVRTSGGSLAASSTAGGARSKASGTGAGLPGVVAGGAPGGGAGVPRVIATPSNRGAYLMGAANPGIKVTPVFAGGRRLPADLGWSDGAEGEDRWGDLGGSLYGLGVMAADFGGGAYVASTLKGDKVLADVEAAGWALARGYVQTRQRLRAEGAVEDYARHQKQRQENTGYPGRPYSVANPDFYVGPTAWQPWTAGADGNKYRTGGGF